MEALYYGRDKHKKRSKLSGKSHARQTLLNATRGKLRHFFLFSTDSLVPSRCSARSRRAKLEKWSWPEFICLRREHRLARPQKATVRDARSIRTRACGGCDLYSRRAQKARWIIAEVPPHGIAEREGDRGRPGRDRERKRKSEMASAVDCRGYFRMYIIDIINSMLLLYVVTSELVETYIALHAILDRCAMIVVWNVVCDMEEDNILLNFGIVPIFYILQSKCWCHVRVSRGLR